MVENETHKQQDILRITNLPEEKIRRHGQLLARWIARAFNLRSFVIGRKTTRVEITHFRDWLYLYGLKIGMAKGAVGNDRNCSVSLGLTLDSTTTMLWRPH